MSNYYTENLSAKRLAQAYEISSSRIKQFLEAEIQHILKKIKPTDTVIEIGCGYGRILERLATKAQKIVGVDISPGNIQYAKEFLSEYENVELFQMDASHMDLDENIFDIVLVVQNGISAFKVNPEKLLEECLRITKNGGIILFSSYSSKIWPERLEWFEKQANKGLLGEIDWEKTKDGVIICKDGFKATTYTAEDFISLTNKLNITPKITEVDESSIFCEIQKMGLSENTIF